MIEKKFYGERLRSARMYRGLTLTELAKRTEISKQSLSLYENDNNTPDYMKVRLLASELNFPYDYFFQKDSYAAKTETTYFRSLASATKKDRTAQSIKLEYVAKMYEILMEFISFPEMNLPSVDFVGCDDVFECENEDAIQEIEDIAAQVRKYCDIGTGPIKDLQYLLEKNGIIVSTRFTNGKKIDAYSQIENINDKIIAVIILGDDKENAFRRNFSAAHELGHLLLDDFYDIEGMSKVEYKEMEDTMNRFAGALLVPEEVYRTDLQTNAKTELNFYIQMKKKYGVSAAALIVRARQLEEITTNQYQYLMKQLSQKGYRTCEPYDKETKQMQPRYLKEAMKMIIEEDKITGTEFLKVVSENGTSISEEIVENILNLDEGYLMMNDSSGEVVALERR